MHRVGWKNQPTLKYCKKRSLYGALRPSYYQTLKELADLPGFYSKA